MSRTRIAIPLPFRLRNSSSPALTTAVKGWLNRGLGRANLQLETLTRENQELDRLAALRSRGYFDAPAFPLPAAMRDCDPAPIFAELERHRERLRDLTSPDHNPVGYSYDNPYFSSPDAEVLYAMVRRFAPRRIVEIGCGNSTKLTRLAIRDGRIACQVIAIDPAPRTEISAFCDEVNRVPAEHPQAQRVLTSLESGDLLFIDSSHRVQVGNDVVHLFLNVLPALAPGVLVHVHDIFLPYEYPYDWAAEHRLEFGEQYLLQLMLNSEPRPEVLWPGYHLQRTMPNFADSFEHIGSRRAQSFWLRTGPAGAT